MAQQLKFRNDDDTEETTTAKRPDSNRTPQARYLTVERKAIRKTYALSGGRW